MEPSPQTTHLDYPDLTMYQMVERIARQYPKEPAYEFYGTKTSYRNFIRRIERAARAFLAMGIGEGDVVTIAMPNTPQALDCFYAISRIGAIANMIHPQSAQTEITYYLNLSRSKAILTVDLFCETVEAALEGVDHPVVILVARIQDELNPALWAAYTARKGYSYLQYPNTPHAILWKQFLKGAEGSNESRKVMQAAVAEHDAGLQHESNHKIELPPAHFDIHRTSVILYSGGTSGMPKGICLSDLNFNACAMEAREAIDVEFCRGLKMLSCMPCFHGFGLGINLHTVLIHGACCILMPTFTDESYANMLVKKKPNFIAGVPTIFEALLHIPKLEHADLSCLMGMFCGGDSLSVELKKKVDVFLAERNASIQVREGYGLTECVTASCLTPRDTYREGSIGLPFPDTLYAIVRPGTDEVMPTGEEGEIILTGPTVMKGYLGDPDGTRQALRRLPDGRTWLYTGDLGRMDEDGYVYYSQRIKRLIITNGYNVYPGRVENAIDSCPEVAYSCVIGVNDPRRMKRVKAFVVLKDGVVGDEDCKKRIMRQLRVKIVRYALPREIEFRESLPKTLVGKVHYRLLEEEENAKQENQLDA